MHARRVSANRDTATTPSSSTSPGFVADLLAPVAVRHPSVPVITAGTRKLAEEWTYRYLARPSRGRRRPPPPLNTSAAGGDGDAEAGTARALRGRTGHTEGTPVGRR